MGERTFLGEPGPNRLYDDDRADDGFVMNLSRAWGHRPELQDQLSTLIGAAAEAAGLTFRQRAVLVTAGAAARGDAYCSLAWGSRLAGEVGEEAAAAVLRGGDDDLDPVDRTLAGWARRVVRDPNATTAADVEALRAAGFDDAQVLALTTFVALRLAFSTVNDALGARPDAELVERAPAGVRAAVGFGRPPTA